MSSASHRRLSRRTMRLWMTANTLVLVGFAGWIMYPSATAPAPEDRATPAPAMATSSPPAPPTRQEVLDQPGIRFGISAPDVPWSTGQFERLAGSAGAAPTLVQTFVDWTQPYPSETVELSYRRGAVPVLSWEPWAGSSHGADQPDYALARIIEGEFDAYLRGFAAAVRRHGAPVVIRFAHEMNGFWFPWSEQNSGNRPGEYVRAWRHVHDMFRRAGASNVIWLWSPNILRPVPGTDLAGLYPGNRYVDWTGLVGYADQETTAGEVFDPTLAALREVTDKPLVITETGAPPGRTKAAWITDFFDWLPRHPDVIGFIWFEYTIAQGGSDDWRFTETPATVAAFREGLAGVRLARSPVAPPVSRFPDGAGPR